MQMRFVTRERIHVDRIATAWAIRRFIDPEATFTFIPREAALIDRLGTPFDIPGVELSHQGDLCTFEVLIHQHRLTEPALQLMGRIVRGADLPHADAVVPEAFGVRSIFDAIRDGPMTDRDRLDQGLALCDALYAYCRSRSSA